MTKEEYRAYLQSDHWRDIRKRIRSECVAACCSTPTDYTHDWRRGGR